MQTRTRKQNEAIMVVIFLAVAIILSAAVFHHFDQPDVAPTQQPMTQAQNAGWLYGQQLATNSVTKAQYRELCTNQAELLYSDSLSEQSEFQSYCQQGATVGQ